MYVFSLSITLKTAACAANPQSEKTCWSSGPTKSSSAGCKLVACATTADVATGMTTGGTGGGGDEDVDLGMLSSAVDVLFAWVLSCLRKDRRW